ncbi:oxidoreductase [Azospirillum argentinense]|uniref:Oxidoreductase n=1 Tax=Azospirillum argentinense TaxID=2970906 RepID=A0A4D8P8W7_9PROT|nr:molybdopterin-dependent oxidoreductase [Azospirillum argentinense]QCN95273.1 oxidoreductase [Azospirillum argentinense]
MVNGILCRFVALALFVFAGAASAGTLPTPTEKPILVVSGLIGTTNQDGMAVFDRPMLEGLGMVSFTTATPWYKEPVTFEGVPLARLMERVEARGETLTATALNDYTGEIPMDDVRNRKVILALKRDGAYMPVSDKGPLFIVYDFDHDPEANRQKYFARSVWQVARLTVK